MLDKIYLVACNMLQKANGLGMKLGSGVSNDELEEQEKILAIVKTAGTAVVSVAYAIAFIVIAVQLIKAGITLADSDKAGPENTARAKGTIKHCVIGLIIATVPFIVLMTGFQSWILNLIKNLWNIEG